MEPSAGGASMVSPVANCATEAERGRSLERPTRVPSSGNPSDPASSEARNCV